MIVIKLVNEPKIKVQYVTSSLAQLARIGSQNVASYMEIIQQKNPINAHVGS